MEKMRLQNETKLHTFELLAPAGSPEILRAVIAAGADAVYLGGDRFGARAYADNFSTEELLSSIDYAHLYGRKVYLTVNTLMKNQEIGQLYDYLLPLYERGLDAVLVQDLGALSFIREHFPELSTHTSTQMTIAGTDGVRLLQQLGAERIVVPREISLSEMKRIHDETGAELEAFVHGALCYCYSGQCLMSSIIGGRSGNRGRCAQPCRLPYAVLDENHNEIKKESYILSLKDLNGIEQLGRLREAGVYSLKIEGRMKQLSYAAGVVSYYRKNIDMFMEDDSYQVSRKDLSDLSALGSRCGFTHGYYDRKNGSDMVTFSKPNFEQTGEVLTSDILDKPLAKGTLTLRRGESASYFVCAKDSCYCAKGIEVMEAKNKPLLEADVRIRMEKTGDLPFQMEQLDIIMDEDIFLPNGALNQLRRDALNGLMENVLSGYRRRKDAVDTGIKKPEAAAVQEGFKTIVLTEKRDLLPLILKASAVTTVYLDFSAYDTDKLVSELSKDVGSCKNAGKEVFFALPRVFRADTSDYFYDILPELKNIAPDGFLVRTYEELYFVKENFPGKKIVTDHNLYTYNDYASAAFANLGAYCNTVPLELNKKEIMHRDNSASVMVVYGRYPLMISAQCVHANTKGCDRKPGLMFLRDRKRALFPVKNICGACVNVVYNSLPVMLLDKIPELKKAGICAIRLDFTIESVEEAWQILSNLDGFCDKRSDKYTNGHYKRGVE